MAESLGTCARCDKPATVKVTNGPGNVRCDDCARKLNLMRARPQGAESQPRPAVPETLADAWAAGKDALYVLADTLWADRDQARADLEQCRQQLAAQKDYAERMDALAEHRAIESQTLKAQLAAAQEVLRRIAGDYYHDRHAIWAGDALRARLDAAQQEPATTPQKKYVPWAEAGGPNECKHGYAEGIPCPDCDRDPATSAERSE